ncbi:MAG: SH3 domain-containing protein [Myxococcota bacterium]
MVVLGWLAVASAADPATRPPAPAPVASPAPAAPAIASGRYGGLTVGFDPATRELTGWYLGAGCAFAVRGTVTAGTGPIAAAAPGSPPIKGTVTVGADGKLGLHLVAEPAGCTATKFADAAPATFAAEGKAAWVAVRVIGSPKVPLRDQPNGTARTTAVFQGDVVGIRALRDGWALVESLGGASGWVANTDLGSLP